MLELWGKYNPPSFFEISPLTEKLYKQQGINTQALLVHKYSTTTELYDDLRGESVTVPKDLKTYRVYVLRQRRGGSEILLETRTNTANFEIAKVAFWQLYHQHYDNKHLLLMTCNSKKINVYRYQSKTDDDCYISTDDTLNNE
ncbi:hypothetical protein A9G42_06795 [Gilliamella sp. Nev6-6]|uniref:hypothetical protein n=1 Tax=Gilliamella sp. Nev6-6 TaxID=3120252 RepID=UPI00080F4DEA|nr:hypothetical protein [Gilliamella apicola]OCG76842.1 hypothetical protein A9G42_06795 [Gilliamella apicola]